MPMRYLIDGHNVIAQLPDIDLQDSDDEAKLVMKLRSFCARTGKQVTVIFDGGIPGGFAPNLSNTQVTVRFSSAEQTRADDVLLNMIRRIKNTKAYTVVSSDGEILNIAAAHSIPIMRTPAFITELSRQSQPAKSIDEKDDNPRISAAEVEEWLRIFSGEDE
jgi:uncharacterized protein